MGGVAEGVLARRGVLATADRPTAYWHKTMA